MVPNRILLMRHAEEPNDPKDPDLAVLGRVRAQNLASYIPATFGKPDFVFAAAVNKRSVRAYLTMRPLCDATAIELDASLKAKESVALATKLLSDSAFADKRIVVCWTHTELPALAGALGAHQGEFPNPWKVSVFNLILQLDYRGADDPTVTSVIQPF
jgi:hypothetical protein